MPVDAVELESEPIFTFSLIKFDQIQQHNSFPGTCPLGSSAPGNFLLTLLAFALDAGTTEEATALGTAIATWQRRGVEVISTGLFVRL